MTSGTYVGQASLNLTASFPTSRGALSSRAPLAPSSAAAALLAVAVGGVALLYARLGSRGFETLRNQVALAVSNAVPRLRAATAGLLAGAQDSS